MLYPASFYANCFLSYNYLFFQEEISKLLRFESSHTKPGERINIPEYINRFKTRSDGQKEIYYIAAPRYKIKILNFLLDTFY